MRMLMRLAGLAVARFAKRYPIIAVMFAMWRWWYRRSSRDQRTTVRLRDGQSISVSARSGRTRSQLGV
ncbi:MAG: hypothetical protein EBT46_00550 [Actinobacteria bacterium]|nr:hypothetical protein [Actinomycetota bacterium]NBO79885.1 hypothetical protein [Actinomycetota bacterium]NBR91995.1 hypothetical protein [Actinomycetota bacterium]NBY57889.1 hypothetical protein [Actinomycetota bacterium]NCY09398.1 hypothetical protein [Actinomycetota bacterium]